jgi:uncharacterized protein YjbI with pentapeptide repeats
VQLPEIDVIDDRLDLRALVFADGSIRAKGCRFENIDFSQAKFSGPFFTDCVFENCLFDGADLSDMAQWRSAYARCSFRHTNFSRASFGASGATYSDCIFERASFSRAVFIRPVFERCRFDNCKLKGVDFNGSSFEECQFTGVIADAQFRGGYGAPDLEETFGTAKPNRMFNVDLSEAILRMVGFHNHCDLSTVIIPQDGNHLLIRHFPAVVAMMESEEKRVAEDRELRRGYQIWLTTLRQLASYQEMYIVNKLDFAERDGERFAEHFFDQLKKHDEELVKRNLQ